MGRAKALGSGSLERNAAAVAAIALGAVWLDQLMGPRWAAMAYGPICSHTALFALHCPGCYAATALIGAGATVLAWGVASPVKTVSVSRG